LYCQPFGHPNGQLTCFIHAKHSNEQNKQTVDALVDQREQVVALVQPILDVMSDEDASDFIGALIYFVRSQRESVFSDYIQNNTITDAFISSFRALIAGEDSNRRKVTRALHQLAIQISFDAESNVGDARGRANEATSGGEEGSSASSSLKSSISSRSEEGSTTSSSLKYSITGSSKSEEESSLLSPLNYSMESRSEEGSTSSSLSSLTGSTSTT